jgi:hypothetical protein
VIVLDANILIRAVLGKHVRQLLEEYSPRGVRFYAPDAAYADAAEYLPSLLERRGRPGANADAALGYLRNFVEPVDQDSYGLFEDEARQRLRGRDEEDWRCWRQPLRLPVRSGRRTRTSLEPALQPGRPTASISFSKRK